MAHVYCLRLGTVTLAPKKNILVEEPDDFERFDTGSDSGECSTSPAAACGPISKRTIQFRLRLLGGSSLGNAFNLKRIIDNELATVCDTSTVLRRRVYDERELIFTIKNGFTRIVEPKTQYSRNDPRYALHTLTIELNLEFKAFEYGRRIINNCGKFTTADPVTDIDTGVVVPVGQFPPLDIIIPGP